MTEPRVIDVAALPNSALDHRSPVWWGNALLMAIETTVFALLVASYFYLAANGGAPWPTPATMGPVPNFRPLPQLGVATVNVCVILIGASGAMALAAHAAAKLNRAGIRLWLAISILCALAAIALRWDEFYRLNVKWNDNAYAGVVWMIVATHLLHLLVGTIENVLVLVWLLVHGLDQKHARDVRVNATYWYWIGLIWIPLYLIVYWGPRWS